MTQESTQQILAVLYGVGGAPGAMGQAVKIDSGIVGQRIGFEVSPKIFDWIEFGGIRRQVLQICRTRQDAFIDEFSLVSLEAVPDEHDRGAQLALQMFEEISCALGIDVGVRMQPKIQSEPVTGRRDTQRRDSRDFPMTARALAEHRGMSAQAPGAAHQWGHQHAGFVEKNESCFQARGVFFTRGQSCSIQARIRSSSRSMARRVGF